MNPGAVEGTAGRRLVIGLQPVREALRVHGTRVSEVWIEARSSPKLAALQRFAEARGVRRIQRVALSRLDQLCHGVSHQGTLAFAPELVLIPFDELLKLNWPVAIALDKVQDPQNFGAVVRAAVGVASAPVIWPESASAPLSPAMFRASAGAIEHAKLCRVSSLRDALLLARERNIEVVGLSSDQSRLLHREVIRTPTILVVGGEHRGLQRSTRTACDRLVRLLDSRQIESLNVSVAAGIALHQLLVSQENSIS